MKQGREPERATHTGRRTGGESGLTHITHVALVIRGATMCLSERVEVSTCKAEHNDTARHGERVLGSAWNQHTSRGAPVGQVAPNVHVEAVQALFGTSNTRELLSATR
jgi:hypothetical protein